MKQKSSWGLKQAWSGCNGREWMKTKLESKTDRGFKTRWRIRKLDEWMRVSFISCFQLFNLVLVEKESIDEPPAIFYAVFIWSTFAAHHHELNGMKGKKGRSGKQVCWFLRMKVLFVCNNVSPDTSLLQLALLSPSFSTTHVILTSSLLFFLLSFFSSHKEGKMKSERKRGGDEKKAKLHCSLQTIIWEEEVKILNKEKRVMIIKREAEMK